MAYILKEDLHLSMLPRELEEISRGEAAIITASLTAAVSEARSYLYDTFDVDVIFAAEGDARQALLLQCVADIAIYYLVARCQAGSYIEDRTSRYDRAIRWLKSLQKSEIYADLPRRTATVAKHVRWGSNRKRTNYF